MDHVQLQRAFVHYLQIYLIQQVYPSTQSTCEEESNHATWFEDEDKGVCVYQMI
jgi:hypothetical protein